MVTSAAKKPIAAYVQRKLTGEWALIITEGLSMPILHSTHESRLAAKHEADRLGASMYLIVDPEK
ncbi:hypothetical protein [Nitrosomonas sp.]|uniref:hypothetical protein n=1 Tax=Nitrosomonas sp. TaxID=42353 RepID=UPI0026057D0A|nr:hypothetical protein [Nitrosomonas sp.]MCW5602732.1 hypothetical protein [Nitrosomonas sp.]